MPWERVNLPAATLRTFRYLTVRLKWLRVNSSYWISAESWLIRLHTVPILRVDSLSTLRRHSSPKLSSFATFTNCSHLTDYYALRAANRFQANACKWNAYKWMSTGKPPFPEHPPESRSFFGTTVDLGAWFNDGVFTKNFWVFGIFKKFSFSKLRSVRFRSLLKSLQSVFSNFSKFEVWIRLALANSVWSDFRASRMRVCAHLFEKRQFSKRNRSKFRPKCELAARSFSWLQFSPNYFRYQFN